jgi:pSer/pThr/pTyr-binding forkhead associated (FHA) protein
LDDTTTNIVGELESEEILESYEEYPTEIKDLEDEGIRAAFYLFGHDKVFSLEGQKEYVLGRRVQSSAEVVDIDFEPYEGYSKGVSRTHAKIIISGNLVTITDLRSSNGTYLNRKRLMPAKMYTLAHGDIVSLGSLILQYHNYND